VNKKKLVELADEVLSDVDIEMEKGIREHFETKLCYRLSRLFSQASYLKDAENHMQHYDEYQKAYESVKPVLDDCLNKILGDKND
jgi:hypothetical protein